MIPERLNKELMEVIQKLRERDRLQSILDKKREALINSAERLKELTAVMEKEGKDLKKYESLSLTALFHTILGSKEEQMEKERQEFLAAKLKYDEAQKAVKDMEAEISRLERELSSYEGIEEQYRRIMKEKEKYMLEHEDRNARRLVELTEELAGLRSSIKELKEAISAGNIASEELRLLIGSLESARNWGTWDMLGGGLISTAVKHSRIDESRDHASRVQMLLRQFSHELEDVNTYVELDVNISSFETFADYFFDGLIFDWIVQSKIKDSLNNAVRIQSNINDIIAKLREKLAEAENNCIRIEKERNRLIEES